MNRKQFLATIGTGLVAPKITEEKPEDDFANAPETTPEVKPPSKTPALDTLWGFGKVIEPNTYLFKISHTEGVISPGELTMVYDTINKYFPNNESLMVAYADKWGYWEDPKIFCVNNIGFIYHADFALQSLRGELIVYEICKSKRYSDEVLYRRLNYATF